MYTNIILFIGVLIIVIMILISIIIELIKQKKNPTSNYPANEINSFKEPEYITLNAKVIDMSCYVKTVGIRMPKTTREYLITFDAENGKLYKLNVLEEMYNGFEIGQSGALTLVDGELYSFNSNGN